MFPSSSLVAGMHKLEHNEILKTHILLSDNNAGWLHKQVA
jgi:hypothetical protein